MDVRNSSDVRSGAGVNGVLSNYSLSFDLSKFLDGVDNFLEKMAKIIICKKLIKSYVDSL